MNLAKTDVAHGLRRLHRNPGFTIAVVTSLMLGIGTNAAIFTLFYAVVLRPLPLENLDRLVSVTQTLINDAGEQVGENPLSYDNFLDYRDRLRDVEGLAIYQLWPMNLTGGSEPQRVDGVYVSGNYFDVLGLTAAHGRLIRPDDVEETHDVAVLSHGCWTRLFGAELDVLERTVFVNGSALEVVGVAPRGFRGTELQAGADVFVPISTFKRISPYRDWFDRREAGLFRAVGRLRDGVTVEQASKEAFGVAVQLSEEYPEIFNSLGAKALPLAATVINPRLRGPFEGYARSSFIVVVILFIACLSVSNLLFVRGAERARELAVRQAMGAGRGRLVRQLLTENLLLFLIGGLASLLVAKLCLKVLWAFRPPEVGANVVQLDLNIWVWAFALAVAILAGLLFGLWPALYAARTDLVSNLKESEPLSGSKGLPNLLKPRSLAVALQVALALVALIGAGLFLRSFARTLQIDLGFTTDELALLSVAPGEQGYGEQETRELYRRLLEETKALPGVQAAALSQNRLLRGAVIRRQVYLTGETSDDSRPFNRVNVVGPGFFETVGIPLVEGRDLREHESEDRLVAIINETMAKSMWPDRDPIGQRFHFDFPTTPPIEVVGVAADARYRQIHEDKQYFIYLPMAQNYAANVTVHARTEGDPAAILPALRGVAREIDPNLVTADIATMKHFVDEALWMERASAWLLSLFGALALALALVGLYGLLSYSVSTRQRELGILIALGARRRHVLGKLLLESLQVALVGIGAGLLTAAIVLRPIMESRLYEVSALDPATYGTWTLVLLLAALAGSFIPAWRAARTNPNDTLRAD